MGDKKDELPVMVYDWLDESIREIAENIWHAQKGGRPDVLTYLYRSDKEKRHIRKMSLEDVPQILERVRYFMLDLVSWRYEKSKPQRLPD